MTDPGRSRPGGSTSADSTSAGGISAGNALAGAAVVFMSWLTFGPLFGRAFGADGSGSREHVEGVLLGSLCGSIVALAIGVLWLMRSDPRTWAVPLRERVTAFLGPRVGVLRTIPVYLAFLLVWAPVALLLVPAVWRKLGLEINAQQHLAYFTGFEPGLRAVLCVMAVALVGPVLEEVVFRGFLQSGLRLLFGPRAGLWITAIAFGVIHMPDGSYLLIPITMLGLLFGWLRERTGGVRASILLHALHNSAMLAIVMFAPRVLDETFKR